MSEGGVTTSGTSVREMLEAEEAAHLAPEAALAAKSRGRERDIPPCDLRTCFQRDRDRIIHCKAFRRLSHKTQVFLAPEGDHYRTRLTHTLEVSQISRAVARALRLNEDLAEAISLGHDLGHTPFGHIGEDALTEIYCELRESGRYPGLPAAFHHNEQSLRVVEHIEYEGKGLNLTWEVRDGIGHHTGGEQPATLEGLIVKVCDRIAYVNHDVDDAVRANILRMDELPGHAIEVLGKWHGTRVNNMVADMVRTSREGGDIGMSPEFAAAMDELRDFLFERVYLSSDAKREDDKAKKVIQGLFSYYLEHPAKLPAEFTPDSPEELPVRVADYVAGMTDRFAIRAYQELFIPKSWMV